MSDTVQITSLHVGHGDAILIQNSQQGSYSTVLIDGGPDPKRLEQQLHENKVERIDLLILTHLDTDHVGGLAGIPPTISIREYWGPCLPAFSRYKWLFGARGQEAIRRGEELEGMLTARGTEIIYPLEGFQSGDPVLGAITILSPAPKLIRRLLLGKDVGDVIGPERMPLDWITSSEEEEEQSRLAGGIDAELSRNALTPDSVARLPRISSHNADRLANEVHRLRAGASIEPEFFGDSLLNNTSLVAYMEWRTDARQHRALFAGDLEDWTYLLSQNPRGLQADILKASHHGGEVRIGGKAAIDEIFASVQPRAVLFCADGSHDLPHNQTRAAAARWGASVFCALRRNREFIGQYPSTEKCCCRTHQCSSAGPVRFTLSVGGIESGSSACHSGFDRSIGPIVRIEQHVVDPSPIVSRLHEGELRRHLTWLQKNLRAIHADRRIRSATASRPVAGSAVITMAEAEGRYQLVANMSLVVNEGMRRHSFWADRQCQEPVLYALPTRTEIEAMQLRLRQIPLLLFDMNQQAKGIDPDSLLDMLSTTALANYCESQLRRNQVSAGSHSIGTLTSRVSSRSLNRARIGIGRVRC